MSIPTLATIPNSYGGHNSYDTGYLDGCLAAVDKTPASIVLSRAAAADEHDPLWAQGYDDGYLHQIAINQQQENRR